MSRVTYLIDKTGVIRDVYHHEVRIGKHVEDVLEGVKALDREGSNATLGGSIIGSRGIESSRPGEGVVYNLVSTR